MRSRALILMPLLVIGLVIWGCNGDDNGGPIDQQEEGVADPANATVEGRVVQADNTGRGLAGAIVTEATTGRSTRTVSGAGGGRAGEFTLDGLPASDALEIDVEVPESSDYDFASVNVPTRADAVTEDVIITVLPVDMAQPESLSITPQNARVERGAEVQYQATVECGGEPEEVEPTWLFVGDPVASFDSVEAGLLHTVAHNEDVQVVRAMVGGLTAETNIWIGDVSAPEIETVLVSASNEDPLPPSGGVVEVTAGITDGDGVGSVEIEVYGRGGSLFASPNAELVAGTTRQDGTWRGSYEAPQNSNEPGPYGNQAPEYYTLRVVAVDRAGLESKSDWFEFAVGGLEAPPVPD